MPVDSTGPSIEDLRTFLFLAESGGGAEVAGRLGIHESAVSRRMARFRAGYGLLGRRGGSLVLTDRGRALLPEVRSILHAYDALAGRLLHKPDDAPTVTIAVGGFAAAFLIPEVVARAPAAGPRVAVRVCRGRERVSGMIDGRFDLAILSHSLEQVRALVGDAPVASGPLAARPFVVVAARETPAGSALLAVHRDANAGVRDLAGLTLVGLDESAGVRTQLDRRAAEAGLALRFGVAGGGWLAAREYARHGLGAAIVPAEAIGEDDARDLAVRVLDPSLSPADHLLHRPADAPRVGPLLAAIRATAADQSRRQRARLGRLTLD